MSTHCEVLTSQVTGTSQSMNDYVIGGHDQRLAPDHLAIITESGEINSIRYIYFLTGYLRNLRPLGHDYPARRIMTTPALRVMTTSAWRVTTSAAEPAVTPFFLSRIGVGPYAFDHTCDAPHAAAIAINTSGRAIGR
jgi:hypothetical protein